MQRSVVYRLEGSAKINVNDEIGIEPTSNYSIPEFLIDLASEGIHLMTRADAVHIFSDGSVLILVEGSEQIALDTLDDETARLVRVASEQGVAFRVPKFYADRAGRFVC